MVGHIILISITVMEFMKHKFVLLIIVAILAGGIVGYSIALYQKPTRPAPIISSGSGVDAEKLSKVMGEINKLAD